MKKLLIGIIEFRNKKRSEYIEKYSELSSGQSPDTLMIACSDSRVAPNVFASTNPGDLFVVRNVGNLVPPAFKDGMSVADESEAAAIEFAINFLKVKDIIICGHSNCGAIQAIMKGRHKLQLKNLREWLRHGEDLAIVKLPNIERGNLNEEDYFSQQNVLRQIEHIQSYPQVQERIQDHSLRIHAWWFDLKKANVYTFDDSNQKFVIIDSKEAEKILNKIED